MSADDPAARPRVLLLYHFFPPDRVVSARMFGELAEDLARRGFDVEAWPSNRSRSDPRAAYPGRERRRGVRFSRCWRPAWSQDRPLGRIANTLVVLAAWSLRAARPGRFDAVILGTDPPMSAAVAGFWRLARPRTRRVQWCFDLYPAAAVAHGWLRPGGLPHRLLARAARRGLGALDAVVDIGPCMRDALAELAPCPRRETLTPWAVAAPGAPREPDGAVRRAMFGDAAVGLLYAGSLGLAHDASRFLRIAAELGSEGVAVAFQAVGEREAELRRAAAGLANVRFLPAADAGALGARLAAADFHLVSLRPGFEGTVVPSKFFAALAAGRPVLFDGPERSSVARWIREHDVGVVLPEEGAAAAVRAAAARRRADPGWADRCLEVGRRRFSREAAVAGWVRLLADLGLRPPTSGGGSR